MKKLLSAVTSFVMSASLMSSAFASPVNVSAAGRVSAEQPNVSMGEVLDGAVNKTAVQADFVVTPKKLSAKPGEDVEIDVYADPGSHKCGQIIVEIDESSLPQGIKYEVEDNTCYAAGDTVTYDKLGNTFYCDTLNGGDPITLDSSEPIMCIKFKVPSTATPGNYKWDFARFHIVEDGMKPIEFDATTKSGEIEILGDGTATTPGTTQSSNPTTQATQAPVTQTTASQAPLTTKAPNPNAQSDFIVTPKNVTVKPGDKVEVEVGVKAGGHKVGQYIVRLDESDLPQGITYTVDDPTCYAVKDDGNYLFTKLNDTYYCDTLAAGEPTEVDESESVITFNFDVPKNAKPGTYNWYISRFHVVEDGFNKKEFDATIEPATITILGDTDTTASQTPGSTTIGTAPVNVASDFIVTPKDIVAEPGETVDVEVGVQAGGHKVSQYIVRLDESDLPQGITYTLDDPTCYAVKDDATHTYEKIKETYYCDTLNSGDPTEVDESESVITFSFKIPTTAVPGEYEWKISRFHVVEDGYNKIEFDANIKTGKINIVGSKTSTTTKTTFATNDTTSTTVTTATTASSENGSSTTANNGKAVWAIPQVTAKAGSTVKMDVIVEGQSDLSVAGAQFNVKAQSPITLSAAGSQCAAYSSKLTANVTDAEFAFGEDAGAGHIAEKDAVIATLSFDVPATASGVYAVNWADVMVSDTYGNDITSQVTLKNGSITVDGGITDTVTWQIPTVHAKPGSSAKMDITVDNKSGAEVPVAGAQFTVNPKAPITFGSATGSNAYNASVISNSATNEVAFANGTGAATSAADGDVVATVVFDIPATATPGTYDVVWGENAFVSDTNGNDITANIKLANGAIIVDSTELGDITWTIPEKHAKAGETVELDVLVTVGEKNVGVSGAQFDLPVSAPISLESASGSDGYKFGLTYNKETNEYAMGAANGELVEAADGSSVIKLTYKVDADAAPGKYPIKWTEQFASDDNGNDITSAITFVDGAIIIDPDTTTSTSVTTSSGTDTNTTTTSATTTSGSDTTTTTVSVSTTSGTETVTTSSSVVTDSTTTTDTTTTVSTTTISVPVGAVAWQIGEVQAQPGVTVEVPVVVVDPNNANLPIGGAQFAITVDNTTTTPITLARATGSSAYDAKVISNLATSEFAFAEENGNAMVGKAGYSVVNLTYVIPENIAPGRYPVKWARDMFYVASADGADMSNQVLCLDGYIEILPLTTSTTSGTTTASDTDITTTSVSTTATTVPSTSSTSATTIVTPQPGAIIWQAATVTAVPGSEVTLNISVLDPNNAALPVGGAQFVMTNEGSDVIAISGGTGSDAYNAKLESGVDGDANRFAFAHAQGEGVAAKDSSVVAVLKYKVSENAKPGTYAVDITELNVSDTNGLDITNQILVINGAIVVGYTPTSTTTTTGTTTSTSSVTTTSGTGTVSTTASTTDTVTTTASTTDTVTTTASTTASTTVSTTDTVSTTASTTVSSVDTSTTVSTTIIVPQGAVGWKLNDVKGKAGEEVTLTMTIVDSANQQLEIGGGQFNLKAEPAVVSATGTPYGDKLVVNPATSEFAFASEIGAGVKSENGAVMMTIVYKIPADAVAGTIYPVNFENIVAVDGNGNEISANVLGIAGSIEVIAEPESTTTTSVTTTSGTGIDTTTTSATTTSGTGIGSTSTSATTTSGTGIGSTSTSATTTSGTGIGSTSTSATTTSGTGIGSTSTSATTTSGTGIGSTSTSATTTSGTGEGSSTTSVSTTSNDGSSTTTTSGTGEGSSTTSVSTTSNDGSSTTTTSGTGEGSSTTSVSTTSNEGSSTSTTSGTGEGSSTTSVSSTSDNGSTTTSIYAEVETVNGFYFSHDSNSFKKGHVKTIKFYSVDEDGNATPIEDENVTADMIAKLTFMDSKGKKSPQEVYDKNNTTFAYEIGVYLDGVLLKNAKGEDITFTAYIGVKGDTNLDNKVDSSDATNVLAYYSACATMPKNADKNDINVVRMSPENCKPVNANPELDQLCAFLGDTDKDVYDEDNWKTLKSDRKLDSSDASDILAFYSAVSTGGSDYEKIWEEIRPSKKG